MRKTKRPGGGKLYPFVWRGYLEEIRNAKDNVEVFFDFLKMQLKKRERELKRERHIEEFDDEVVPLMRFHTLMALGKIKLTYNLIKDLREVGYDRFVPLIRELHEIKESIYDYHKIRISGIYERLLRIQEFVREMN